MKKMVAPPTFHPNTPFGGIGAASPCILSLSEEQAEAINKVCFRSTMLAWTSFMMLVTVEKFLTGIEWQMVRLEKKHEETMNAGFVSDLEDAMRCLCKHRKSRFAVLPSMKLGHWQTLGRALCAVLDVATPESAIAMLASICTPEQLFPQRLTKPDDESSESECDTDQAEEKEDLQKECAWVQEVLTLVLISCKLDREGNLQSDSHCEVSASRKQDKPCLPFVGTQGQ